MDLKKEMIMENYVCKIASLEEMNLKWDYEIECNKDDKYNWLIWKEENIIKYKKGYIIPYYGILNEKIICEATANINSKIVQNSDLLVDTKRAYLSAFRTIKEYQGKGYFSKLMKFMLNDLKNRGYTEVTLGVEPTDEKSKKIYEHYGFNEYLKGGIEKYPDGTIIDVEYYLKKL